jgi:hypothetical protein
VKAADGAISTFQEIQRYGARETESSTTFDRFPASARCQIDYLQPKLHEQFSGRGVAVDSQGDVIFDPKYERSSHAYSKGSIEIRWDPSHKWTEGKSDSPFMGDVEPFRNVIGKECGCTSYTHKHGPATHVHWECANPDGEAFPNNLRCAIEKTGSRARE